MLGKVDARGDIERIVRKTVQSIPVIWQIEELHIQMMGRTVDVRLICIMKDGDRIVTEVSA